MRDRRHEPHVHEARGVRDLGRHRRARWRADRRLAAQHELAELGVRRRASRCSWSASSAASRASAVRCSPASASRRSPRCRPGRCSRTISWFPNLTTVTPGLHGHRPRPQPERRGRRHPRRRSTRSRSARSCSRCSSSSLAALYAIVLVADIGAWWFIIGGVVALIGFTQRRRAARRARRRRPRPRPGSSSPTCRSSGSASTARSRPRTSQRARRATRTGGGALTWRCSSAAALTVRFGGHLALDDVDVDADAGLVTGLIGPNGAGKTTLFNAVCGLLNPTGGSVRLDRARARLARAVQAGAPRHGAHVPTARAVRAAHRARERAWSPARCARTTRSGDQVAEIIERVGLGARIDDRVDELPTGQARLVEIARALATRPRVLLLDEPASGLDEQRDRTSSARSCARSRARASRCCSSSTTCTSSWRCAT